MSCGDVCGGGVKDESVYMFPLLIDVWCWSEIVVCSVIGCVKGMFEGVPVGAAIREVWS